MLHAKRMATHMANMGHITGRKEMGEMIESAQAIVAEGNELTKTALNLASRCSDKRLKEDIASLCNRINTIGVQLKIVASVKATCGDGDSAQSDAMMHNSASVCPLAGMCDFSDRTESVRCAHIYLEWT